MLPGGLTSSKMKKNEAMLPGGLTHLFMFVHQVFSACLNHPEVFKQSGEVISDQFEHLDMFFGEIAKTGVAESGVGVFSYSNITIHYFTLSPKF